MSSASPSSSGAHKHAIGDISRPDRAIAELAGRQHGVVAVWQMEMFILSRSALAHRAAAGHLHRVHHGVYAVGHGKLTREGRWMAAVLAYGRLARLSHRTAAALWGLHGSGSKIDIMTPTSRDARPGIRTHRAMLDAEDIAERDGIPVTSVARTILDLARLLDAERLTRVVETAERLQLFDLRALERALERRPRARGTRRLRAVLDDYGGAFETRSDMERDFLAFVKRAGLPPPQANVLVAGVLVDACWPQWRLVVELDSRSFHLTPRAFERDRIRDAILQRNGYRILRVTWKRLKDDADGVLSDLLALRRPRA